MQPFDPHKLELMLLSDPVVVQGRVFSLSAKDKEAGWAVAISLALPNTKEVSSSDLLNSLRERLAAAIKFSGEEIFLPDTWVLTEDFPLNKDGSVDDEQLRLAVDGDRMGNQDNDTSEEISIYLDYDDTFTTECNSYILSSEEAEMFCKSPTINRSVSTVIELPHPPQPTITRATILHTAWALAVCEFFNTDHACFSVASSISSCDVPWADEINTPITTTVPMQVYPNEQLPISTFLHQVQNKASRPPIRKSFTSQNVPNEGEDNHENCLPYCLIIIQSTPHWTEEEITREYAAYPLVLQVSMLKDTVEALFVFDITCISKGEATLLMNSYKAAAQKIIGRLQGSKWLYKRGY